VTLSQKACLWPAGPAGGRPRHRLSLFVARAVTSRYPGSICWSGAGKKVREIDRLSQPARRSSLRGRSVPQCAVPQCRPPHEEPCHEARPGGRR
jgi:hypothetical protein